MMEDNAPGVYTGNYPSWNNTSDTTATTDVATRATEREWEEPFTYRNFVFSGISLVVNTVTIVVLCRTRLLGPRIRVMLISMTTNDVLFSLVCGAMTSVPIWMILLTPLCYLLVYATIFSFFNSCFSITLITIDRMLALHCPLLYRQHATMTKTATGVLSTWLAAGLFTLLAHVSTSTQLTAHVVPCVSFAGGPSYGMLAISVIALVCVVAVTVMHVMIFLKIRKRQKLVAPAVFRFGLRSQIHHASANDDTTGKTVAKIVAETGCVAATVGVSAGTPSAPAAPDTAAAAPPSESAHQDTGSHTEDHSSSHLSPRNCAEVDVGMNRLNLMKPDEAAANTRLKPGPKRREGDDSNTDLTTTTKTEEAEARSERPQSESGLPTKAEFYLGDERLGSLGVHGSSTTAKTDITDSSPATEIRENSNVMNEKGDCTAAKSGDYNMMERKGGLMDRLMVPTSVHFGRTVSSTQMSSGGNSGTKWSNNSGIQHNNTSTTSAQSNKALSQCLKSIAIEPCCSEQTTSASTGVIQASVEGNNTGNTSISSDACKSHDEKSSRKPYSNTNKIVAATVASTNSEAADDKRCSNDGRSVVDSTRTDDDDFIQYKVLVPSPTPAGQLGSAGGLEPFNHLGAAEKQTGLKLLQGLLLGAKFSRIVATKITPLDDHLTGKKTPETLANCSDDSLSDSVFVPPDQGSTSVSTNTSGLPKITAKPAAKSAVSGKTIQTKAIVHAEATDCTNVRTPTKSLGPANSNNKTAPSSSSGIKQNKADFSKHEYNPNFLCPPERTFPAPQTSASTSLAFSSPVKNRTAGSGGSGKADPKQRPSVFTISDGRSLLAMKTAVTRPEYSTALACTSAVAVGSVWSSASETISALSSTTIWSMHLPDLTRLENQHAGQKSLCERLVRRLRSLYRWRFFSCTSAIGRAGALTIALTSTFIVAYVPISSYLVWASSQRVFVHEPSATSVIYYMVLVNFVEGIVRPIIYIWRVVGFRSVAKTCTCCCRARGRGRVHPFGR